MIECRKILFLWALVVFLAGSFSLPWARAEEPTRVFVSIEPQRYFVESIGGSLVQVSVMVQPGASPATYEPKPRQMADLSKARIYFAIGVPFENTWLKKIAAANPQMWVVHTDQGIEKIPMAAYQHHDEREEHHGKGEDHKKGELEGYTGQEWHHEHGILDPHIWLSPPLVKIQARTILNAFQQMDPSRRNAYEANYHQFVSRIDALDKELKKTFAGKQGLQFMVFHPSWGYFAQAYGLRQVPIEVEGKDPKPGQLKGLIEHAREKGIRVVFAQPQFSTKSATLVAREIGGQVVFADPLARDWVANLREVAEKFKAALR